MNLDQAREIIARGKPRRPKNPTYMEALQFDKANRLYWSAHYMVARAMQSIAHSPTSKQDLGERKKRPLIKIVKRKKETGHG